MHKSVECITEIVAEYYNIHQQYLFYHRRHKNISMPRQVAMYFCRKYTDLSFSELGKEFGDRHHSTIIHGVKNITNLRLTMKDLDDAMSIIDIRIFDAASKGKLELTEKGE